MDLCKRGHEYTVDNTYIYTKTGRRTCKTCHRDTERNRIQSTPQATQNNRDRVRAWAKAFPARAKATRQSWLDQIKALIAAGKAGGCAVCAESDQACLDFHHKDPTEKLFNIGVSCGSVSLKKLRVEIAKCVVLCSNCHRKFHAATRPTNGLPEGQD